MKRLLLTLSASACGLAFADIPAPSINDYWSNIGGTLDFNDAATWNQYNNGGTWVNSDLAVTPWEYRASEGEIGQTSLKIDNATINVTSATGTPLDPLNIRLRNLWSTTLNIAADFSMSGSIQQDGSTTVNIYNGAQAQIGNTHNLSKVDIYEAGTSAIFTAETNSGLAFNIRDGASVQMINGVKLRSVNADSVLTISGATFSGGIEAGGGGTVLIENSTFNTSRNNESITTNGGIANFTMSNTIYNGYYTGWDPTDTVAKWRGNVMFIGLGGGTQQQTYNFTNGTIVNWGGAADGTSYWAMDAATRTRANITDGGNVNMGWNAFNEASSFMTVNIESGTKFAGRDIEMGNNSMPDSLVGKLTWNQSGTNETDGYTEVILGATVNVRGARVANSEFGSEFNMGGFTKLEANNFNVGQNGMVSGYANFNIKETNNTVFIQGDLNMSAENMAGGISAVRMTGGDNSLSVNNIRFGENQDRDNTMGGTVSIFAQGMDSRKNSITIRRANNELIMQGSIAAGSTFSASMTLAGNTDLLGGDGKGVWLKLNEWGGKAYTSDVNFTVSGANNNMKFSGIEIGNNVDAATGTATFSIIGSGSTILIANDGDGHNGFRLQRGGKLEYHIDNTDTGISAIKNTTWNNTTFSGQLLVDFSALTDDTYVEKRYELFITTDMSLQNHMSANWFDFSDWNDLVANAMFISIEKRDASDTVRFALENKFDDELGVDTQVLAVYYTSTVPEPATYAAIFGALALALAAYRRRK